jgi:hypothetical protein
VRPDGEPERDRRGRVDLENRALSRPARAGDGMHVDGLRHPVGGRVAVSVARAATAVIRGPTDRPCGRLLTHAALAVRWGDR